MKNLIYDDVLTDIEQRMNKFEGFRTSNLNNIQDINIKEDVIKKEAKPKPSKVKPLENKQTFVIQDNYKPFDVVRKDDVSSDSNENKFDKSKFVMPDEFFGINNSDTVKKEDKSDVKTAKSKKGKSIFNSISNFFSDNPVKD